MFFPCSTLQKFRHHYSSHILQYPHIKMYIRVQL
nr:unnamed protein product [Callosobruchus analis]